MKKSLILVLSVLLLVICLISCDEGVTHLGCTYEYIVYETGHFKQYTCGCPSPDIMGEHYDHDSNDICDACGYDMSSRAADILSNLSGCEWFNEINPLDIARIDMISGGGGPLPPISKTYISSSTDKAVISSIVEEYYLLDVKPVSEEQTQIPDGGYFTVNFIFNDGSVKSISFINGDFYHDGNGNYYEISHLPVFRDGTNFTCCFGFETWERESSVYLYDGLLVAVIPTAELRFVELTDDIELGDKAPTHYIEMRGERINFLSECYFYIGDDRSTYYQLVGKNLEELLAENAILYD